MIEFISTQPVWFWLCLGGLLLIAELLGTGGYLLWSGIAAVTVGVLTFALPFLSWEWQGILFAVFTVVSAILWRKWLSHRKASRADDVNQISHQLVSDRVRVRVSVRVRNRGGLEKRGWGQRGEDGGG